MSQEKIGGLMLGIPPLTIFIYGLIVDPLSTILAIMAGIMYLLAITLILRSL